MGACSADGGGELGVGLAHLFVGLCDPGEDVGRFWCGEPMRVDTSLSVNLG